MSGFEGAEGGAVQRESTIVRASRDVLERAPIPTPLPVKVVQHSLLVDNNGSFTMLGALGTQQEQHSALTALSMWDGVSQQQVNSFRNATDCQTLRAREMVFTALASMAAWLRAQGFLEPVWAGRDCPQSQVSSLRLSNWKVGSPREVRPVRFRCKPF